MFHPEPRHVWSGFSIWTKSALILIPVVFIAANILISITAFISRKEISHKWRNSPRNCPNCGVPLKKLKGDELDKYLEPFEKKEENLKSEVYDVWLCSKCGEKIIEKFEGKRYGFYVECPKCHGVTGKHIKSKVLKRATELSAGEKEPFFTCLACSSAFTKIVSIPIISDSSSGSGFSSESGEGSSFGGGSSGGGGSTSSW